MANRTYNQGVASIGFDGGPQVVFRLNPDAVDWNFKINTNVTETIGGRVVQVLGATLSNLTIKGSFGEQRGASHTDSKTMAESFLVSMKAMADWQSRDSNVHGEMHKPAVFSFPTKNWKFLVYIMDLSDPDGGGSITHRLGKFAYDYILTLFIYGDVSNTSHILGSNNGVLANQKDAAIQSYMDRIFDGIGWHLSAYNGPDPLNAVTASTAAAATKAAAVKVAGIAAANAAFAATSGTAQSNAKNAQFGSS